MAQLRMNIIINIKFSANVLPLTIFALFAYSCTKENETTGARIYEGEKIPMSIKMGARNTTADDDEVIKSVRAIVFNDKNELVYNDVSDASINVDNIYIAPIRAARGYNNIYIICNETPELTEKLAAITLLRHLCMEMCHVPMWSLVATEQMPQLPSIMLRQRNCRLR